MTLTLGWMYRHALWSVCVGLLALLVTVGSLWGAIGVFLFGLALPASVGAAGQLICPERYGRWVQAVEIWRVRRRQQKAWRKWARAAWPAVALRCGLGQVQPETRAVQVPPLVNIEPDGGSVHFTVRALVGQTSDHLASAAPPLRDALSAFTVRADVVSPGAVRFSFQMQDLLAQAIEAAPPLAPETGRCWVGSVPAGRCEDGAAWHLQLAGRQTLITGCSGSGKGSLVWAVACGLSPAVSVGLVSMYAIDLKYGVEVKIGEPLFTAVATFEEEAIVLLERLNALLAERGRGMAGTSRSHTPTTESPLVILVIDELASLTAYISDRDVQRRADKLLRSILTKGRALGVVVVAAIQDPRKETVPARGLFTQTVALRLSSKDEVSMVLGAGAAENAPAHQVSPSAPGTGYMVDEAGAKTRVRAAYWHDDLIRQMARLYPAPTVEPLVVEESAESMPSNQAKTDRPRSRRSRRRRREPATEPGGACGPWGEQMRQRGQMKQAGNTNERA